MSWERDPLWAKARLFFERAFNEVDDNELFGLWCSFGLELLARAAIASISPTLLAEPDPDHKFLLQALNRAPKQAPRKSIAITRVLGLCRVLFDKFSDDDFTIANALINRRNDELHSGTGAFAEYPPSQWLAGFYHACASLTSSMGESLQSLFDSDTADAASKMLEENRNDVRQRVESKIAAHRRVFEAKPTEEQEAAKQQASEEGKTLSHERNHRVECPACRCTATVQGDEFGPERINTTEDCIEIRQSIAPRSFRCTACGLLLAGYGELEVAGVGGYYTRTISCSAEEYYGLVDLETFDAEEFIHQYLSDHPGFFAEYDNE
jgi:hypothetical protein